MTAVSVQNHALEPWADYRWSVRPAQVLLGAIVVFALGNVGRIPLLDLGGRQAPLLINDIAVCAVVFVGIIAMGNARSVRFNDVALAALAFAAIGALAAFATVPEYGLSWFEVFAGLGYLVRWCTYFGIYLTVINCLHSSDIERTWSTIHKVFLAMAAFGVIQAVFLPNFAFMVHPEPLWDPQGHRLVSTILDPNIMAGLLSFVLLVQLSRMAFGARVPMWQPTLLGIALLLTLSRGGMLAFGVGAALILIIRGPTKRMMKLATGLVVAVLPFTPLVLEFAFQYRRFSLTDGSTMARVISWGRALDLFAENPWLGVGFNTYAFVQEHRGFPRLDAQSYSTDGGLLFIAVMTGLVGLSVYVFMLWCVLRRCKSGWKDTQATAEERGLLLGVFAATIAMVIHSLFVNTLLITFMMELLWIMWGLSFLVSRRMRQRRSERLLPSP